jgi:signal peptidase I
MPQIRRLIHRLWQSRACRTVIAAAAAALLGAGAGRTFLGSVYVVDGESMEPSYPAGTHLYGAAITTPLDRGDVILLNDGKADYAVKRIVGLPGETVQLWRGQVFVNRQMLVEPYLPKHTYTCPVERTRRGATFILGDGEYFVLGDNRLRSSDSRAYGPVHRKQIRQRVPLPVGFVGAHFAPYTLPEYGKTLIRPIKPDVTGARAAL